MLGDPGWRGSDIRKLVDGANFFGTPSGSVEKNEDPYDRRIHDYGYYLPGSCFMNVTHSSASVKHTTLKEPTAIFKDVAYSIQIWQRATDSLRLIQLTRTSSVL